MKAATKAEAISGLLGLLAETCNDVTRLFYALEDAPWLASYLSDEARTKLVEEAVTELRCFPDAVWRSLPRRQRTVLSFLEALDRNTLIQDLCGLLERKYTSKGWRVQVIEWMTRSLKGTELDGIVAAVLIKNELS